MTDENKQQVVIPPERRPTFVGRGEVVPLIPKTIEEVAMIASAVMAADMVPKSYEGVSTIPEKAERETKSKLMIGIMKGLEVGFGPMTALSTIAVINNRPCIWGDGAVALCQQAGVVESVVVSWTGTQPQDDWTAIYTIRRKGQAEPYVGKFSVADAKRAHLWNNAKKTPWIEYPQRMLLARARAFALREGFADCLMGLSIAEEIQDLPEAPKPVDPSFLVDASEANAEADAKPADAMSAASYEEQRALFTEST